jgi:hypothetical protein
MVKQKYAGEEEIRFKIKELFAYRKLTDLMQMARLDKDRAFVANLTEIQFRIYLLDAYLESEWILDPAKLKQHWDQIEEALRKLVPAPMNLQPLLAEIHEYERIELNCRKNKWPTRERFKKFYTIKSCDVRLIRHLIYEAHPSLEKTWKEKAWAYYDLITEINDDVADLFEDLATYNGNRFLISMLRKGTKKTGEQYKAQLTSISGKAKKYFQKEGEATDQNQLYAWTSTRAIETEELLAATLAQSDHTLFTSSYLLGKMK